MRALVLAVTLLLLFVAPAYADVPPVVQTTLPTRLEIPSIGVDADVVTVGLDADGAMLSPDGPYNVGWYDFSPTPGNVGNTVFAGHRDWHTGVTGVFWRLGELQPGDTISVVLEDGSTVEYSVVLSVLIGPDDMAINDVVGQTPDEEITLITCEGWFDSSSHDYDKRRVVWGVRVPSA